MSRSGSTRPYWILLVVWLGAIFFFSTDSFSGGHTSAIIVPILKFLFPGFSDPQLEFWHLVCRKAAHVTEYFVLGVLACRTLASGTARIPPKLLAAGFVVAVAFSDEFHQLFVASRGGSIIDVGYDCIGGMMALILMPRHRNETGTVHSHSVL